MKHSPETRMYLLATRFRGLINAPGINPLNAAALDDFAMREDISDADRCAARFLPSVWDSQRPWKSGQFNVIDPVRAVKRTTGLYVS